MTIPAVGDAYLPRRQRGGKRLSSVEYEEIYKFFERKGKNV
jgi:hypothetical protein